MKERIVFIGVLLIGLLSICPAAQEDRQERIDRIEEQIRDLEQQRQYMETENYETARTITSLEQQIKDKQSLLDHVVTLNQRLSKYDRRINDARIRHGQAWEDFKQKVQDDPETATLVTGPGVAYPLLQLHYRARRFWNEWWNVRMTTVSAIDDEIEAVNAELTGPVRIRPDRPQVTLSGLEDFRRVVRAELLRAQTIRPDILEMRRRLQDMQHRLTLIDGQREDARRLIDRLKRDVELLSAESGEQPPDESATEEQTSAEDVRRDTDRSMTGSRTEPPPASIPKQPRVINRILDVTPSQILGTYPQRRCVWRFYIELEEANDVPVELLFKRAVLAPKTQDPDAAHRHDPPPMRYSIKPGDTVHLGGWRLTSTGMWLLAPLSVSPGVGHEKAARKRTFGPFYLTVWETGDFAGEFRAVFESVRPSAFAGEVTQVVFKPQPPAWARIRGTIPMRVVHPTAREIASGSLGGQNFQPYIEVDVDVPDLPPGMYSMRVEVDTVGPRYLWSRLKRGSKKLKFKGNVPMLPGRRKITLSMPDLPQVVSEKLDLNVALASNASSRESIRSSQKQIRRLQSEPVTRNAERARRYRQRLANSYSQLAFKHMSRGEYSTAKSYIDQSMNHLRAAGAADELTTGGYGGDVTRGTLLRHMATVAYFTSSTGEVRKNLKALADYYEASAVHCKAQGDERTAQQLHGEAAKCYWKMAEQLLMLGNGGPGEAANTWRLGQPYWKKTAARGEPRKPDWWPE